MVVFGDEGSQPFERFEAREFRNAPGAFEGIEKYGCGIGMLRIILLLVKRAVFVVF
jgi:hypothetical protein